MAGLCEGGNEPPGSLKASKPVVRFCKIIVLMGRKGKNTSFEKRQLVIFHHVKGRTHREIAEMLNMRRSTVRNIIRRYENEDRIEYVPQRGQSRKLTDRDDEARWNDVIFVDESPFSVFDQAGRVMVWRKVKKDMKIDNLQPTVKHGGGKEEEKELVESLAEKKLLTERYTGRNGERENSSERRRYQMIDDIKIYGSHEETKRKAENRKDWGKLGLQ
ncbi:hypothetical protein ANN_09207 [Periplaneta americana]|uniref:Uncharacterized protein n=1 Tax=Periplaneta americana TaxID=6978 RepID=A0ABQ8TKT9_PERAM|nr:hypothetical protein ANN_09207 [Periplaneta americana]